MSVLPGIHYFMGGILVDEQHRTPIQNLFALPENAVPNIMKMPTVLVEIPC